MIKAIQISILVLILAAVGCFVRMIFTERSFEYRAGREKEVIDSIRHRYDSLMNRKVDSTAYATFKKTQEAANREIALAKESQKKFKHEKDTVRVFSDPETDSLLRAIR